MVVSQKQVYLAAAGCPRGTKPHRRFRGVVFFSVGNGIGNSDGDYRQQSSHQKEKK
jgi:hypothetical protein